MSGVPKEDHGTWRSRWTEGRTGFHQSEINAHLQEYIERLESRGRGRILVPLAGKTRDMTWLTGRFAQVLGVEFVEQACHAFFEEQELPYEVREVAGAQLFAGEQVSLLRHDMLAVERGHVGDVDAVFDRAALIALTPEQRQSYAKVLTRILDPGTPVLLVTLSYDQNAVPGPPFSVSDEEVDTLFGQGFAIEKLEATTPRVLPPRFAELDTRKSVWLLTRAA